MYDLYRERFDCMVDGDNEINFHVQQMYFTYLFLVTSDLETYEEFQSFNDFETRATQALMDDWNVTLPDQSAAGAYFFEFPETCNWLSWTTEGKCSLKYKGLSSLFGVDVEINVAVEQCERDFPSIYIECEGEDCDLFTGIVECDPDVTSSCLNAACQPIKDVMEEIYISMQSPDPEDPNWEPKPLDSDYIAQQTGIVSDQCFQDTTKLEEDFTNVLRLLGLSETATHICSPDFERSEEVMEDWKATQWELVDDRIHFIDLVAWIAPEPPVEQTGFGVFLIPSLISFIALVF